MLDRASKSLVKRVPGRAPKSELGKARERLEDLGFDPIENLVALHDRLVAEDEYQNFLRHAVMTAVSKEDGGEGFPRIRYSSIVHASILSQLEKVNADLLAYGYCKMLPDSSGDVYDNDPLIININ